MKNYFIDEGKEKALYSAVFLPVLKQVYSFVDYIEYYYPKGKEYFYDGEKSTGNYILSLPKLNYRDHVVLNKSLTFNEKTYPLGSTLYNWTRPDTNGADCSTNPSRKEDSSYFSIMSAPLSIIGTKVNGNLFEIQYTLLEYSGVEEGVYYLLCHSFNRNFSYMNGLDKTEGIATLNFFHLITSVAESKDASTETVISTDSNFFITPYYESSSGFVKLNVDENITINSYNELEGKPSIAKITSEAFKEDLGITFATI